MLEFEILARGLYRPDQLDISYDPALTMPTSLAISAWMDTFWQQKLAKAHEQHIPLFDAPLFRFISAASRPDGTLHLVLGNTGYKEYVTTRVPEFFQGRSRQEVGNALAVCSVIETNDGHILLDKRQGVDGYVGRYHVIGGFFERQLDTAAARPDPFGAICREIREETGIQLADIAEQYCLGVVYDVTTPHAEMCFLTRLKISLAEVSTRTPEEDEIKQLQSLAVTAESLHAFVLEHHGNISATGEPNVLLYGALRFGERWFEEVIAQISTLKNTEPGEKGS
jgi:8-oxo-dGTP pyrophosphatase MutT (NUDIX family)